MGSTCIFQGELVRNHFSLYSLEIEKTNGGTALTSAPSLIIVVSSQEITKFLKTIERVYNEILVGRERNQKNKGRLWVKIRVSASSFALFGALISSLQLAEGETPG